VLLSESAAVSKDNREKVTEHMFETFLAPALFLSKSAVLSSFALGRQTSLVLDIGYEGTIGALVQPDIHC
jgi:actin-like protein 6A